MSKPTPLEVAINAIKTAPRCNRGVHWAAKPTVMGLVAVAILGAKDQSYVSGEITKATGVKLWTLRHFIRGNDASGNKCQSIHDAVSAAGLMLSANPRGHRRGAVTASPSADAVPPAEFTVNATAVAPVADPITVPPATLAVTNKGEVIVTTPPPPPTTMAAKPGEFATKSDATRCVLDTKTKDILVITTRRIEFGTPAWCEKMVEINSKPKA